jgi:hypothetical protein
MLIYTVHEPSRPAQALDERADEAVFIKEGFTWWGFLFGPFWLLFNALWFEFAFALILSAAAAATLSQLGLSRDQSAGLANLLVMLIVGFEGNSLRNWRLERKGYRYLASVAGESFEECERRFFDAWLPTVAKPNPAAAPKPALGPVLSTWGDWPGPGAVGTLPGEIV